MEKEVKTILFICKANRFRSKIAEAYFNKINKNPRIKIKSAGIISGNPPVSSATKEILSSEFNIKLSGNPKPLNQKLLNWADLIVIVANDVPPAIFSTRVFKGKLMVWKIKDAYNHNEKEIKRVARQIISKIDSLVRGLND